MSDVHDTLFHWFVLRMLGPYPKDRVQTKPLEACLDDCWWYRHHTDAASDARGR